MVRLWSRCFILRQSPAGLQDCLDEAAPKGRNLYPRIRYAESNGQTYYTGGAAAGGDISLYPNPVDNVLIIRTESCSTSDHRCFGQNAYQPGQITEAADH